MKKTIEPFWRRFSKMLTKARIRAEARRCSRTISWKPLDALTNQASPIWRQFVATFTTTSRRTRTALMNAWICTKRRDGTRRRLLRTKLRGVSHVANQIPFERSDGR